MKTKILIILILISASTCSLFSEPAVRLKVIKGVETAMGGNWVACLAPYDDPCTSCDKTNDSLNKENGFIFFHDPTDPYIGTGYTDVDIEYQMTITGIEQFHIEINSGNIIYYNYQNWLDHFNFENPLL